jgi:hypothetical protein
MEKQTSIFNLRNKKLSGPVVGLNKDASAPKQDQKKLLIERSDSTVSGQGEYGIFGNHLRLSDYSKNNRTTQPKYLKKPLDSNDSSLNINRSAYTNKNFQKQNSDISSAFSKQPQLWSTGYANQSDLTKTHQETLDASQRANPSKATPEIVSFFCLKILPRTTKVLAGSSSGKKRSKSLEITKKGATLKICTGQAAWWSTGSKKLSFLISLETGPIGKIIQSKASCQIRM